MTALCFVDANVLVYYANPSEPMKQELARALINRLWIEQGLAREPAGTHVARV